jgi:hypothetical protein
MNGKRRGWLMAVACGLVLVTSGRAWALGEEQVGNEALSDANYAAWKGLIDVINDKGRVYYNWVNGNENFYFAGDTAKFNEALKKYAASGVEVKEVVLRPAPAETTSFDQSQKFPYNWHLQIFGGIAAHLTTREFGDQVWNKHPRLTVYVGGEIELAKLEVPKGVTLVSLDELSARARKGIASKHQDVRGWCAGVMAALDPHSAENQAAIEKLLADDSDWVRLTGAGAVASFGAKAKSALPALKACLERPDENLQKRARESIATIEAAKEDAAGQKAFREAVDQINKFIADHQKQ